MYLRSREDTELKAYNVSCCVLSMVRLTFVVARKKETIVGESKQNLRHCVHTNLPRTALRIYFLSKNILL